MTARGVALVGIAVVLASGACAVRPSGAAGPWRGQVVEAETGQPLEGVVVLAVWDKISPGTIHPRREFHDVDEVVTDAEGNLSTRMRQLDHDFNGAALPLGRGWRGKLEAVR